MKAIRIIFFTLLLGIIFPNFSIAQKFDYEVRGEIKGLGNDTLVFSIRDVTGEANKTLVVAKNDKFSLKGQDSSPRMVSVQVLNSKQRGSFDFFTDRGLIKMEGSRSELDKVVASGSPVNDEYNKAANQLNEIFKLRSAVYKEMDKVGNEKSQEREVLTKRLSTISDSLINFQVNYIKNNPRSMFSAIRLFVLGNNIPVLELEALYNSLQSPAKEFIYLKDIPNLIVNRKASEIGQLAPGFTAKDKDGKVINLADYKGEYVLIEFWASWCVPCRKENPGLRKAYQQFKDKPFEIISISVDDHENKWREAIEADQLTEWVHICDPSKGGSKIAKSFGVQPIPDNFLIDTEGKIVGRKLFGTELENKLKSIFTP